MKDFLVLVKCLTYNHASYIEDTMNGFCMQETSFPFIAIICDDASTDGEQKVIEHYIQEHFDSTKKSDYKEWETEEAHLIYAHHKENSNCYFLVIFLKENYYYQKKNKSHIWEEWEESAKYIALCEGDDYWTHPLKLQKQVDFLEKHPDHSLSVHEYNVWNDNKKEFENHQLKPLINNNYDLSLSLKDYSSGMFFTKTLTCLYRKTALMSSKYTRYDVHFDMPLFYALMTQGKCRLHHKAMGCYRIQPNSITSIKNIKEFRKNTNDALFSICREEKTIESKTFVYNYLKPFALSVILHHQIDTIIRYFKFLNITQAISLSVIEPLSIGISIIKSKLSQKPKTDNNMLTNNLMNYSNHDDSIKQNEK